MSEEELKPDPHRKWVLWGIPVCVVMAFFELDRALGGNHRSWVYVAEWPFFAIFIIYMYIKLSEPQEPEDHSGDPKRELEE